MPNAVIVHSEQRDQRYFLDPAGVPTVRMAGKPGAGHIEVAMAFLGRIEPGSDVYAQMFALEFVRVLETGTEVFVDAPRKLTKGQRRFLDAKRSESKTVAINRAEFIQSRGHEF